ncbi:hypothetical protein [Alicyclobacillus acidiphilus]|nr:hypothetical protein [Alicyclobacillus acidiphilus]
MRQPCDAFGPLQFELVEIRKSILCMGVTRAQLIIETTTSE